MRKEIKTKKLCPQCEASYLVLIVREHSKMYQCFECNFWLDADE